MPSGAFNRGKKLLATRGWLGLDIRALLVTASYTPNVDHNTVSQLTNELSGGNYVRRTVAQSAPTQNDADNRAELDAADTVWSSLGIAAGVPRYVILYHEGGGADATRELLCWIDLGTSGTDPNGGNYTVRWDATGVLRLGA